MDALLVEGVKGDVLRRRAACGVALLEPPIDRVVEPALRRGEPLGERIRLARDRRVRCGRPDTGAEDDAQQGGDEHAPDGREPELDSPPLPGA